MGSSAKKIYPSSRRLVYDGPYARVAPGAQNALQLKRLGAWSSETADPQAERTLGRFPLREISRPSVPPRRT